MLVKRKMRQILNLLLGHIQDRIYLYNFLAFIFLFTLIYYFFTDEDEYTVLSTNTREDFNKMTNFLDFLYYSIMTQSTVGYGDITPNSNKVRILSALQALTTVLLISF